MSDTPRTDAAAVSREFIVREMDIYGQKFVLSDFARELERELNAKKLSDERWWMIYFDDADRKPEIFTSEAAARHRYKVISASWNAHLFVRVESNSRDFNEREALEMSGRAG